MVDVPLTWQLAKFGLSVSMVLGLGTIAVRASPRIAGLLSGYPLGTALALFFIRYSSLFCFWSWFFISTKRSIRPQR